MFGRIAIKKEIYACETAQICVGLHIGELIPLGESSHTSHYIFYSVKYFFLVHDYALLLTIKSLTSKPSAVLMLFAKLAKFSEIHVVLGEEISG